MSVAAKLQVELSLLNKMTAGLAGARADLEAFGKSARALGRDLTMKLTLPIVAGAAFAVKAASDQAEAQSAVDTVYGKSADAITEFSMSSARDLGISRTAALSASVTFAGLGKSAGLVGPDLVDFSTNLIGAASDLGSFYNVDPGQVLNDLRSGLAGESEPLRKYNIFLDEATVAQKAMAMTGKTNADQLTAGDKIAARSALILSGLGDAQGDFARTSEGLANSLRIAKAQLIDTAAILGTILLPYVTLAAQKFAELALRFQKLSPRTQKFILIAAGILAVLGPVIYLVGALATALAFVLSPIGLIIIALALLYLAYRKNFLGFGAAVDKFVKRFLVGAKQIIAGFMRIKKAFDAGGLRGAIDELFGKGGEMIMRGLGKMLGAIPRFIGDFLRGIKTGFQPLDNLIHDIGKVFSDVGLLIQHIFQGEWSQAFDSAKRLLTDWLDQYQQIGAIIVAAFAAIPWGAIWDVVKAALSAGWEAFKNIDWSNVASAVWDGITAAFAAIPWDTIGDYLIGVGDALVGKGQELLQGMRNGIEIVWNRLVDWLGGRGDAAVGALGELGETLLEKGKSLFQGLRDGIDNEWRRLAAWFKSLRSMDGPVILAIGTADELMGVLKQKGKDILEGFRLGVIDKWDTVRAFFHEMQDKIAGQIPNPLDTLHLIGYEIVQGMANGLNAGASLITSAVDYLISLIPGPLRAAFGLFSPSKLMREMMYGLPQGMALGMLDGRSLVSGAANKLAISAIPGTSSGSWNYAGAGAMSGGGSGGGTVTNNIYIQGYDKDKKTLADEVFAVFNRSLTLKEGS